MKNSCKQLIFLGLLGIIFVFQSCNNLNVKPSFEKGFIKYFGGVSDDFAASVEVATDGYVISGTTSSFTNGLSDVYVAKADLQGNLLWQKNFGGLGADSGSMARVLSNGDIIVVGSRNVADSNAVYLIRLSANGDSLFGKIYQTVPGSFFLVDNSSKNIPIVRNISGYDVSPTADGGFIIGGSAFISGFYNALLLKLDAAGQISSTILRGFNNNNTVCKNIIEINKGGTPVYEWMGSSSTQQGTFILARNSSNNPVPEYGYDKTQTFIKENSIINGSSMKKIMDNSYIITGTCINNGIENAYLLRLKGDDLRDVQEKIFFKTYGEGKRTKGIAVDQTSDGGFILLGTIDNGDKGNDYYLVKTDAVGNVEWTKSFGGDGDDQGKDIRQTKDNGYIILGTFSLITTPVNNRVMCLIKTDSKGEITNK